MDAEVDWRPPSQFLQSRHMKRQRSTKRSFCKIVESRRNVSINVRKHPQSQSKFGKDILTEHFCCHFHYHTCWSYNTICAIPEDAKSKIFDTPWQLILFFLCWPFWWLFCANITCLSIIPPVLIYSEPLSQCHWANSTSDPNYKEKQNKSVN